LHENKKKAIAISRDCLSVVKNKDPYFINTSFLTSEKVPAWR